MPRRGSYRRKQLAFRTDQINASGSGRAWKPVSKRVTSVCHDTWFTKDTTTGTVGAMHNVLDLTNWVAPLFCVHTEGTSMISGTTNSTVTNNNFNEADEDDFNLVKKHSCMYRFTIRFTGGNSAASDFVFAYKFSHEEEDAELNGLDSDSGTRTLWLNIRMSSGWVWRRFSGINSGGSIFPSSGIVDIKVPSVGKLVHGLYPMRENVPQVITTHTGTVTVDDGIHDLAQIIESNDPPNITKIRGFLHIVCFNPDGSRMLNPVVTDPFTIHPDITIDVAHYDKATLTRSGRTGYIVDEADYIS